MPDLELPEAHDTLSSIFFKGLGFDMTFTGLVCVDVVACTIFSDLNVSPSLSCVLCISNDVKLN
jgi:hypothetical protein